MRIILLFSLIFIVAAATYLEDRRLPAIPEEDDESEIVIKKFNKCSKGYYFDFLQASCLQCRKCPKGQFAINECKVFDNTECASCSNKALSDTRAYRANCRSLPVHTGGYRLRDGARNADIEVPWKTIEEIAIRDDILDKNDDEENNDIPDLPDDPRFASFEDEDDEEDEDYEALMEAYDISFEDEDDEEVPKKTDAQKISKPIAWRPIKDNTGILEVMRSDDDSSDSSDSDESSISDSNSSEEEIKGVIRIGDDEEDSVTSTPSKKFNLTESMKAWNLLTKFLVFTAYCFAVMSLFVVFRYAQNLRKQRTFNVQPLVMTPDQHNDLVRTVNYLQSKRRGPFKYEPLEEFV
jgi:hypothetical protein